MKVCGGDVSSVYMADTDSFDEAEYGSAELETGYNTITISSNWTWFAVDYVRIEKE